MQNEIKFEMNQDGHHRLAYEDEVGDWATYRNLSTLEIHGVTYVAATDYGLLPEPETAYRLERMPTVQVAIKQHPQRHQKLEPGMGTSLSDVRGSECSCELGSDHY